MTDQKQEEYTSYFRQNAANRKGKHIMKKMLQKKKIEWFTPGDFKRLELNNSSRKLDCDLIEGTKMFPKGATLIIGIGGTLGKIGFIVEQAYSNQQITAVIPNDNKIFPA